MSTLWVATDTGVNLSANIVANVSEQRDLRIDAPFEIGVLPGQDQVVNFTVTNSGNLEETFDVEVAVDGGWVVVPASQTMTLPIDDETLGSVTVTVPELGDGISLNDGSVHNLTIRCRPCNRFDCGNGDSAYFPDVHTRCCRLAGRSNYRYWTEHLLHSNEYGNRDGPSIWQQKLTPGGVIESNEWSLGQMPKLLFIPVLKCYVLICRQGTDISLIWDYSPH